MVLNDDFDGDGIPNRLDLDSDGDGCLDDVIEAGFTDADGDGVPGDGAPTVGTDGKISGHSYADPQDANSNNVDDFLETSYDAGIYSHPVSVFLTRRTTPFLCRRRRSRQDLHSLGEMSLIIIRNYAYMNSNNLKIAVGMDPKGTNTLWSVVEFDSLTSEQFQVLHTCSSTGDTRTTTVTQTRILMMQ